MSEVKKLDIIKQAILLEHKGKALYESVVQSTKIDEVKALFIFLAEEEEKHIKILNQQYKLLKRGEVLDASGLEDIPVVSAKKIISNKVITQIFGAGYEAAVISAALEFEKNAVKYYSEHAYKAESNTEKKIFLWLTDWEKTHLLMLARLDDELREQIWYDNQFWPLD